ncbi:MAG: hypothetical protein NXI27_26965 [Alphaproteobacteria bacterium]|nr:hypothetical protein [Alphaproteobacteria bacterium]
MVSILEIIVLLIGASVISVLLYGAYKFWTETPEDEAATQPAKKVRKNKARSVLPKTDWPIEAVSGRRSS